MKRLKIMYKFFKMSTLITLAMLLSCIAGCGNSDDDPVEKVDEPVKINLLATSPESGGTIPATGDLRIVFDNSPESVTVDGIPAIILNNTAIVTIADLPDVTPGSEKTVIIEWRNPDNSSAGAKTITFTVLKPIADTPQSDDDGVGPLDATTVTVSPAAGTIVQSSQEFSLTFDQGVTAATVNSSAATGAGRNWTASPILVEGIVTLIVEWTNRDGSTGSKAVGPYLVDDPDNDDVGPPPATDVVVNPPPGAILPSNQEFSLTFDQGVTAATVNGSAATGAGRNWTASPILVEGIVTLIVEWTNRDGSTGSKAVGPYVIKNPDVTPPVIVAGTVIDGDRDVDPAPINVGGFRFDFNEDVTGRITLTDEAGADLNWIATVWGQTATLTAVAGQELANETTYKIEIDVSDRAGNGLPVTITFVTKPKE